MGNVRVSVLRNNPTNELMYINTTLLHCYMFQSSVLLHFVSRGSKILLVLLDYTILDHCQERPFPVLFCLWP